MFKQTIIISVGGSLVCPSELDAIFLQKFKNIILAQIKLGKRIILITGGGKICRKYNEVARQLNSKTTTNDLDLMGIRATRLNAELVRLMFGDLAYGQIVTSPKPKIKTSKPVIVAGGWKPGASSDNVAVNLAQAYQAKKIINLTNIDYVYDRDPAQYPQARPLEQISWLKFRQLVGSKWDPGLNAPFDPIASKLAAKLKLEVVILNGKNLNNLADYLNNKQFIGSVIK